mgnify:CR=1 FL=1
MQPTLLVITGMSGSGKSVAIKALEDIGFFCVDNLPIIMLPDFIALAQKAVRRMAIVVDTRQPSFSENQNKILKELSENKTIHSQIIFLDSSDQVLLRRFAESRRPHPLGQDNVQAGIQRERELLTSLREVANLCIDTSNFAPHQLRQRLRDYFSPETQQSNLKVTLLSFGFKHGLPPDADLVFDVRFLPNPYWVKGLRPMDGEDIPVREYLEQFDETAKFLDYAKPLLQFSIENFQKSDRHYLTIAIGCTGGQHRSVYVASSLRNFFEEIGVNALLIHRDKKEKSSTTSKS